MTLTKPDMDTIEQLIDRAGLAEVLAALVVIADAKAEHVEENWQDAAMARAWTKTARRVERAMPGLLRDCPLA